MYYIGVRDGKKEKWKKKAKINLSILIFFLTIYLATLKVYTKLKTLALIEAEKSMAAFRYPHRTRPNSGPDQIILVLKLITEPIRSWCCLHIHAKFWSAAAVGISGPISVS